QLVFNTGGQLGYAEPDASDPTKPWTFHPISPKSHYQRFTHGLGVGDVNGDGANDVITSIHAHGYGLAWHEQIKKYNMITFVEHKILDDKPAKDPEVV